MKRLWSYSSTMRVRAMLCLPKLAASIGWLGNVRMGQICYCESELVYRLDLL